MPRSLRPVVPTLAVVVGLVAALPAGASADTSSSAAARKAVAALGVRKGTKPVVVFRQPRPVPARTAIGQAGASTAARADARPARERKLRRAGVTVTSAPVVTRTGSEAAWLFYADEAPYQAYQHRGRVVLVGQRTGRVTVTRALPWPPVIAGRLPVFLRSYEAYRAKRHRVFVRAYRLRGSAPTAKVRTDTFAGPLAAPLRDVVGALRSVSDAAPTARAADKPADPAAAAASKAAADALAAERSCAIRVSDTLGDFYDVGPVDRTRAELGTVFERLAGQNPGFRTARYRYLSGTTPAGFVARAVRNQGCKDVLLYLGGGGYADGAPAVNVGTRSGAGGRIEQQLVTATDVRAMLRAHRDVTFKVLIDAPYSGAFLPVLRGESNLVHFAASSGAGEGSFTALSDVTDAQGRPVPNAYNAGGHLEFTNRQLEGLKCFLSRPDEVAAAARAKAEGRTRSFFAWMLARSFALCAEGSLTDLIDGAPSPVIDVDGGIPPAPPKGPSGPPTPPVPPAPVNRAPSAVGTTLATTEDTAVSVTLAGADPDGDPLTPAVADTPTKGTLSGEGATRVYTPSADATGTDTFTFTVSDGRAGSAPATVTVRIDPENDAPRITPGAGTSTFTEGGAGVAVDPQVVLVDVDDDELQGATLAVGPGFAAGEDELQFADTATITGAYDAGTGVLALTGTATVADYQAAVRSVRFATSGANPSAAPREISIRATDGELQSTPAVRTVAVATVNDAPVLGGGGTTAAYTEDDATGVTVAPALTVADVDSPTLASATVRITGGLVAAEDRLTYADADGIAGNYDAATGVLTLTGSATLGQYRDALRRVRYRNVEGGDPSTATRTFSLAVNDGADADAVSNTVTTTATVAAVNDAPTVTAGGTTATFTEDTGPAAVDPGLIADDADDATLAGATVRVAGGADAPRDALALPTTPGLTSSYDAATSTLTITGTASTAAYQAALRSVTFATTGDDPSTARRAVRFTVTDGDLTSDVADAAVDVVAVNDAPVLGGGGNTVTFEEDNVTGVPLDPSLTVTDVDSATLESATVTITAGLVAGEDRLEYTDGDGIAGAYDAATGALTLSGTATKAEYQAALRRVRYRNTNTATPSDAVRTVQFRVNDGAASSNVSTATVTTVQVTPSNDPPTATPGGGTPTFTEGGTAVVVDPGLTLDDVDDTNLVGATVTVNAGFVAAEDRLAVSTDASGITASYASAAGVLTLSGSATVAQYQAVLRTVTYENVNGTNPSPTSRGVRIVVDDGDRTSVPATTTVAIQTVNDAPVLTTTAGLSAYVEDDDPVAVDPGLTVADIDHATLSGATVTLDAGQLTTPQGRLAFVGSGGITGVYDTLTGVLTLSGTASVANYQATLRSVTFEDPSDTPNTTNRLITFRVTDSANAASANATKGVSVTPTNDRPVTTAGGGSPVYTESGPAETVDPAVTVSDPDSPVLDSATVCLCMNFAQGEDELAYDQGTSTIAGTYDAATGTLTLTGSVSAAEYQAALRRVTYSNSSTQPSTAARRIDMRVSDGPLTSTAASTTLTIDPINTAPTLTGGDNTVAYTEDDPATVLNASLAVTDPDDTQLDGATVRITAGFAPAEDRLLFTNAGAISGSYDVSTGLLTLTGKDTLANYQAALRSVRYRNLNTTAPSTAPRTVGFVVDDGDDESAAATTTVTVAEEPDVPVVTPGTGNVSTFVEDGSPVLVDDTVTVTDVDSTVLSGATVSITTGFSSPQGDTLEFTNQNGIAGSYNTATGVLTLSGTSSVANYQAALRSVRFGNTSQAPTGSRTVTTIARDDTSTASAGVTHAVNLQGVNDAPTLGGPGALAYTENDPATSIAPAATLTDVDSATMSGARVRITTGLNPAEDVLSFADTGGITGSYDAATGTLTLSGAASTADYQAALRNVRYRNTSDAPSEDGRTVVFEATDSGTPGLTATSTSTVAVTAVNDAPTTVTDTDSAVGNTRLARGVAVPAGEAGKASSGPSVVANDTDIDGPGPITVDPAASSATSSQGGTVGWNADGTFVYVPPTGYTGTDTLTYRATDGDAASNGTVNVTVAERVWYVQNTATANGTGRSSAPFDTLAEADAAADAANDRIYVFRGTGDTTGLTGGVSLLDGQRLIGEAQDLQVGADVLYDSAPSQRPSVAGSVAVEDGNTVTGLAIDGGGGAAIAGNGDAGGTLADLQLTAGAGGTGLALSSTTGTWNVSDTTVVATSSGEGITLANAGTVAFASAGTVSVSTTNGRGLTVADTSLSGTIDSTTVQASPTTGVSLTSTTGSLVLDDLNLTTTGSGLLLNGAMGVTVNASGDADVTSAGPAVDLSSDAATPPVQPKVALDQVTSTGGANGIRLSNIGTGTFTANGGSLSGHVTAEVSVAGGSGDVTYPGTIGNGAGLSARVHNRTGGTVTLAGAINDTADAGGGIASSGSSGGTVLFSGATKTLNTGASNAVDLSLSGAAAVRFTGGSLDIDTTSGTGLRASGGGTVGVTGAENTIAATAATALDVNGPDIATGDLTFRSLNSAGAVNGVRLADTGTDGGLNVTGSPVGTPAVGSGGTVSGASGAGYDLTNARDVRLAGVTVQNGQDDGIRGTGVNGFALTAGSQILANGNADQERGLDFTELAGVATLTGATVTGSADDNMAVANDSATLSNLTVDGGTVGLNDATDVGEDGIRLQSNGTGALTATIQNVTFDRNRGDHVQVTTDGSTSATQNVTIQNNTLRANGNQPNTRTLGGGITVNVSGSGATTATVSGNDIERANDSAILVNSPLGSSRTVRATVRNNVIGTAGEVNSGSYSGDGIFVNGHGASIINALIQGNDVRQHGAVGIDVLQNDGNGTVNATVVGNTVEETGPDGTGAIRAVIGSAAGDVGTSCLDIGSSSDAVRKNKVAGTALNGGFDIRLRMAGDPGSTANLVGYGGGPSDTGAVGAYLQARNNLGGTPTVSATQRVAGIVFGPAASCPQP
ncbi:tandem-95 repeat protein [Patulibacter americanus]|uniref:tandem-95 repeat protein n=1 Tax=Patulibacter americanus TaxID=588672 RepID=UPI000A027934|nr:tandem-95 repeat protein [Patulibacter americanus]